jgi:hypothetical protein
VGSESKRCLGLREMTILLRSENTMMHFSAPGSRYVLPGGVAGYPGYRLREGRSIYRMEAPSTFYYGTDERGYPSGEPQNPRTGD